MNKFKIGDIVVRNNYQNTNYRVIGEVIDRPLHMLSMKTFFMRVISSCNTHATDGEYSECYYDLYHNKCPEYLKISQ